VVALQNGFAEIRGLSRRARVAAAIAIGPVAELAIRLFLVEPFAKGNILGGRRAGQ
jgi:hypothetical protein